LNPAQSEPDPFKGFLPSVCLFFLFFISLARQIFAQMLPKKNAKQMGGNVKWGEIKRRANRTSEKCAKVQTSQTKCKFASPKMGSSMYLFRANFATKVAVMRSAKKGSAVPQKSVHTDADTETKIQRY